MARASFDEVVEFDEFYRDRLCRPEDTDYLLVLSFDTKGIATLHRDLELICLGQCSAVAAGGAGARSLL